VFGLAAEAVVPQLIEDQIFGGMQIHFHQLRP
jgi:hypothetical protein